MSIFTKKQLEDRKDLMVKCEECKHWVDKEDAQGVSESLGFPFKDTVEYYCQMHKRPYDRISKFTYTAHYYKTIPATEIEVTKEGKPVKK